MKISYKDLTEDLIAVDKAYQKDPLSRYSVDIIGEMKTPNALKTLNVIDGTDNFETRAQFVKELLEGCLVEIYKDDIKIITLQITRGLEWWAVHELDENPLALRYLVTTVYTRFLKNFVA